MTQIISEDRPAGSTRINCPSCGQIDVPAEIVQHVENVTEAFVLKVASHTTWWVVCGGCKARLFSKLPGPELRQRTPDELVGFVAPRVSLIHQFLAVASVVLAITPFVGICMSLIAYFVNRKSPGWTRKVSKAGLWLTGILHLGLVFIMLFAPR
jgi:hypothetical protein